MPPPVLSEFDFHLPPELIAATPARPRDAARLLVVPAGALGDRAAGSALGDRAAGDGLEDRVVRDLPGLLRPGDLLVLNDTRVIPARLRARRGEAAIGLLLNRAEPDPTGRAVWHALVRNARRLRPGDALAIEGAPELPATVVALDGDGSAQIDFGPDPTVLAAALERVGEVPLPPYLPRADGPTAADRADYQSILATRPGAVAAPTASLHLTEGLLAALDARGVRRVTVTLHVGAGTFLPIRGDDPDTHRMHAEWGEITPAAAATINTARAGGGRIVAWGTTALRLLETAATATGTVAPFAGLTELFLRPGHRFRTAELLVTNFHLPRSSLFLLVAAFAGPARMRAAYAHAIAARYRFYSYGDASLLALAP